MKLYLITNVGTFISSIITASYRHQLILAHLWDEPGYSARVRVLSSNGITLMLDTGVHEGASVHTEIYAYIIEQANPAIVVLPDIIHGTGEESRNLSMLFFLRYSSLLEGRQVIYVSHGRTEEELLREYGWAMNNLDAKQVTLAICRPPFPFYTPAGLQSTTTESVRERLLCKLMTHGRFLNFRWHILGAGWQPSAFFGTLPKRVAEIVSIDTVKPCVCALANTVYPDRPKKFVYRHESTIAASDTLLDQNIKAFENVYRID